MKLAINLVVWILVAAISLFPLLYVIWELNGDLRGNVTIEEKIFVFVFVAYIVSLVLAIVFRNALWAVLLPYILIVCMIALIATYFIRSKTKNMETNNTSVTNVVTSGAPIAWSNAQFDNLINGFPPGQFVAYPIVLNSPFNVKFVLYGFPNTVPFQQDTDPFKPKCSGNSCKIYLGDFKPTPAGQAHAQYVTIETVSGINVANNVAVRSYLSQLPRMSSSTLDYQQIGPFKNKNGVEFYNVSDGISGGFSYQYTLIASTPTLLITDAATDINLDTIQIVNNNSK